MSSKPNFKNSKGYTLVEVMMVVGIMGLVGLGAATMMKNAMSIQSRQQLRPTLRQIKFEIEQSFLNNVSWEQTFNNAANNATGLQCLRTGAACADNTVSNAFVLLDSTGATVFDETNATAGWRYDGSVCNNWAAGGTDACPIRYDLNVRLDCPNGGANCENPTARMRGSLLFRPSDRTAPGRRVNVLEYAIDLRRGQPKNFETFRIFMEQTAANNNGGLGCSNVNNWNNRRPLNRLEPTGANAPTGVTFDNANDRFTLVAGRYKCEIMVETFGQSDGFKIAIREFGTNNLTLAGGGISPAYTVNVSHFNFFLNPTADTAYEVVQMCSSDGVGTHSNSSLNNANYEFGVPAGAAAAGVSSPPFNVNFPKVFTDITCVRSS